MTEGMEAITTNALGLALDVAAMRQQVISANIANAETPGYAPLAVNFEAQLDDARSALQDRGQLDATSLAGVIPKVETNTAVSALGLAPKVMLDMEVAQLSKNGIHYQVLVKGLSKHFSVLSAAVSDGKK